MLQKASLFPITARLVSDQLDWPGTLVLNQIPYGKIAAFGAREIFFCIHLILPVQKTLKKLRPKNVVLVDLQ